MTVLRAGLRRGMLLRFREPAKTIAEGPRTRLRLKQVPPVPQRILPRAKRKPCPENNASEPGGRPAAGRGCAKEKFLYYIVVPGLAILHEIGDGDAV